MAMLACKFRLYPSRAVEEKLDSALNGCRRASRPDEPGSPAVNGGVVHMMVGWPGR